MKQVVDLIFVYGTLLLQENEFAQYLNKNGKFINTGRLRGRLYDLGSYPAAVPDAQADDFVQGLIIKADDVSEVLRNLDHYEGIGEPFCEYVRELVEIETPQSKKLCWTYLYNFSEEGLKPIPGGDYLAYKKTSGC